MKKNTESLNSNLFGFKFECNYKIISIGISKKNIGYKEYHEMLGHPSSAVTTNTGKFYKMRLSDYKKNCEACILGKARQKNVAKATTNKLCTRETESSWT